MFWWWTTRGPKWIFKVSVHVSPKLSIAKGSQRNILYVLLCLRWTDKLKMSVPLTPAALCGRASGCSGLSSFPHAAACLRTLCLMVNPFLQSANLDGNTQDTSSTIARRAVHRGIKQACLGLLWFIISVCPGTFNLESMAIWGKLKGILSAGRYEWALDLVQKLWDLLASLWRQHGPL